MVEAPALATRGRRFLEPRPLDPLPGDRFKAAAAVFDSPIEQGASPQMGTVAFRSAAGSPAGCPSQRVGRRPPSHGTDAHGADSVPLHHPASAGDEPVCGVAFGNDGNGATGRQRHVAGVAPGRQSTCDASGLSSSLRSRSATREHLERPGGIPPGVGHDLRAGWNQTLAPRFVIRSRTRQRDGAARGIGPPVRVSVHHHAAPARRRRPLSRYLVGVSREDGTAGLSASYQFFLSTVVPRARP